MTPIHSVAEACVVGLWWDQCADKAADTAVQDEVLTSSLNVRGI